MGLLTKLTAQASFPKPQDDWSQWGVGASWATQAGVNVNADSALRYSAVYACTKVLAEGVAVLPLITYRRRPDGGKERVTGRTRGLGVPPELLHDDPNRWQTSFEWREMSQGHLTLRGNAYSEMIAGPRGFVDELIPLHPDRIKVFLLNNGDLHYTHREKDGSERPIEWDRMFHLRGLSNNGLTGLSVVGLASDAIGKGLAIEGHGARLFSQGTLAKGIITRPGGWSPDAAKNFKKQWQESQAGLENMHKVAVLDEGMDWKQIGMTSKDAQFLEWGEFSVKDVARWFRVPPHMIGILSEATFSNIEKQSIEFVVYTLMPWLKRWEQRISKDLILDSTTFFAEFLVAALLRGDTKERYEAYGHARQWGWLSVNDIRRLENLNPIPNGDVYLQPINMAPAATGQTDRMSLMAREAASRVVRREVSALGRAAKRHADDTEGWQAAVCEFYADHAEFVAQAVSVDSERAERYVAAQRELVLERGVGVVQEFEEESTGVLMGLAMGEERRPNRQVVRKNVERDDQGRILAVVEETVGG